MNSSDKTVSYAECCAEQETSYHATFEKENVARYAEQLGGRISQLLHRLGTMDDAAKIAGVSISTLRRWARGESGADFAALRRLAAAAGTTMDWLASGEGQGPVEGVTAAATDRGRLQEIEGQISQIQRLEAGEDEISVASRLADAMRKLKSIAGDPKWPDLDRARAERILSVAFADSEAEDRLAGRLAKLGADERALADSYAVAVAAVGWTPPALIQHAVTQALRDGLSPSGAVTLLSLLRAYDSARPAGG